MTGIGQFRPETVTIPANKQLSFTVRGLNLFDMTALVTNNLDQIEVMATLYRQSKGEIFSRQSLDKLILAMLRQCPHLASEVISVVTDDPEATPEICKTFPFAVQVQALAEIARMTTAEAGGLKNLSAILSQLLQEVLPAGAGAMLGSLLSPKNESLTTI